MPEPKTEYDYGAYCGLYCGSCAILLANERGVAEKLLENEKAAAYTVDDLTCHGCRTDVVATWCPDCEMRLCARRRGVAWTARNRLITRYGNKSACDF